MVCHIEYKLSGTSLGLWPLIWKNTHIWMLSCGSVNAHLTLYVTYLYHVITLKWKRFFWKPEQNPKKKIQETFIEILKWKKNRNHRRKQLFKKKSPLKQHNIPPRLIFKHWHKIRRIHEFILTEITDLITGIGAVKIHQTSINKSFWSASPFQFSALDNTNYNTHE